MENSYTKHITYHTKIFSSIFNCIVWLLYRLTLYGLMPKHDAQAKKFRFQNTVDLKVKFRFPWNGFDLRNSIQESQTNVAESFQKRSTNNNHGADYGYNCEVH